MMPNILMLLEKYGGLFAEGLKYTLLLALLTVLGGVLLGSLLALMRMSKFRLFGVRPLSALSTAYVEIIRGTPLLLQLYFFYFLVPEILPFEPGKFASVSTALLLNSAGYVAEIIRAGIQAVDKGQTEAARSLGLNGRQAMLHIVMPQAVKNILPALCNEFVMVVKETSLASTFFLGDLMTTYRKINGALYMTLEPLIIVGVIYFLVTFTLSKLIAVLERRLKAGD